MSALFGGSRPEPPRAAPPPPKISDADRAGRDEKGLRRRRGLEDTILTRRGGLGNTAGSSGTGADSGRTGIGRVSSTLGGGASRRIRSILGG